MITPEQYDNARKVVQQYLDERKKEGYIRIKSGDIIPEYVDCGNCILIYREYSWHVDGQCYLRTAGSWAITFEIRDGGKVFCDGGQVPDLIGKELIPATRKQYLEDNKGYVVRGIDDN